MELAKLKDEMLLADRSDDATRSITQLQELELALIGGGMGDVQQ